MLYSLHFFSFLTPLFMPCECKGRDSSKKGFRKNIAKKPYFGGVLQKGTVLITRIIFTPESIKKYFLRATKVATQAKMPPSGGKMALYIMLFHKRKACPEKLIIGIFVTFGAKIRVFASHLKIARCTLSMKNSGMVNSGQWH